jgi:hypothetical protein
MNNESFNEALSKIHDTEDTEIRLFAMVLLFSTKVTIPLSEEEFNDTAPQGLNRFVYTTVGDYVSFIRLSSKHLFN